MRQQRMRIVIITAGKNYQYRKYQSQRKYLRYSLNHIILRLLNKAWAPESSQLPGRPGLKPRFKIQSERKHKP